MQVLLRRLWIQITSDRKRFGVLCAMAAIGMLLWARIIVTTNVPRTAVADPSRGRPTTGGLGGGASDKHRGPPLPVKLARIPARDPLLVSEQYFPKPTDVDVLVQENGKSGPEAVENVDQAEARLTEELRTLANRFKLEGVMQGYPMAVINGKTYEIYEWVPAVDRARYFFQLVEVGNRSIVLECEGRRFRLKMDDPGSEIR